MIPKKRKIVNIENQYSPLNNRKETNPKAVDEIK